MKTLVSLILIGLASSHGAYGSNVICKNMLKQKQPVDGAQSIKPPVQALEPVKNSTSSLSDAVAAEIQSIRESALLYQAAVLQITRLLSAEGVENANSVAKAILDFKNNDKSVREIVAESKPSTEVGKPSQGKADSTDLVLKTQRLEIRAIGPDKLQEALSIWADPQVVQMSGKHTDQKLAEEILAAGRTQLADVKDLREPTINFGIYENGTLVGMSQIASGQESAIYTAGKGSQGQKWASVSYHIKPSAWGQGIATEASSRLVKFAFEVLKVDGLHGEAIDTNARSIAILKDLGFVNFMNYPGLPHGTSHFYMDRAMYEAEFGP